MKFNTKLDMEINALRSVLNRFAVSDIRDVTDRWHWSRSNGASMSALIDTSHLKKSQFIRSVVDIAQKEGISSDDIGELELIYIQKYSKKKVWSVYEFETLEGDERWRHQRPSVLVNKVRQRLKDYFDADVHLQVEAGDGSAFWLCVRLHGSVCSPTPPRVVYALYHTGAPVICLTRILAAHRPYVVQAFADALQFQGAEPLQLTGRCVESLSRMASHRHSEGAFSRYSVDQLARNPLGQQTRKRKADDSPPREQRVCCENESGRRLQRLAVEKTFGPHRLPQLENVSYQMETDFRGPMPSMRDLPFRSRVRFEGRNVLEGLRALAAGGVTKMPVKAHLALISSSARNFFVLRRSNRGKSIDGDQGKSVD